VTCIDSKICHYVIAKIAYLSISNPGIFVKFHSTQCFVVNGRQQCAIMCGYYNFVYFSFFFILCLFPGLFKNRVILNDEMGRMGRKQNEPVGTERS